MSNREKLTKFFYFQNLFWLLQFVILVKLEFNISPGGVVEWFKALVLKTSVSARVPWVRIPPPPFIKLIR